MDKILTDLSTPALQRAIKENLFEFCRAAAQFPGGELQEDDSFSQWYSGVPHPWFNAVLARRPGNDRDVDRVKTGSNTSVRNKSDRSSGGWHTNGGNFT
jgi:hypothetical protein